MKRSPQRFIVSMLLIVSVFISTLLVTSSNANILDVFNTTLSNSLILYPLAKSDIINEDGNNITTDTTLLNKSFIGDGYSLNSWLGVRFPLTQKISSLSKATIDFYIKETQWINLSTEVYVEKTDSSQPFSTSLKASDRRLSDSKITYANDIKSTGGNYIEIDITKLVQELLTTNPNATAITVIFKNTSQLSFGRKFFETDFSNSNTKPKLVLSTGNIINNPPVQVPISEPVQVPQPTPSPIPQPNLEGAIFVSPQGNDSNNGSTSTPLKTIQKAIDVANTSASKAIYLKPGIYRESPELKSVTGITISSEQKDNPGVILGSENSQSLQWQKGTNGQNFPKNAQGNVYFADITNWNASPEIAYSGNIRFNKALEPDLDPFADTSVTDNRWTAEKGINNNSLIDSLNLKNINGFDSSFLKGARVFVVDGYSGHDQNTGNITSIDSSNGQIVLDKEMKYFDGKALMTTNSKYYVEGKAELLDNPGEWFYDSLSKKLYMWAPNSESPQNSSIEFGVRTTGLRITNSKDIIIKDININYINYAYGRNTGEDGAIYLVNKQDDKSSNITFDNVNVRNSAFGVRIFQSTNKRNTTENIYFKNSTIENIDGIAFVAFQYPYLDSNSNYIKGIRNLFLENNNIRKGGYRPTGNGGMMWIIKIQNFVMKNNLIEESAHNGIEIQVAPESNVLIQNNTFKNNCLSGSDCGGFKIWGGPLTSRNILVVNNVAIGTKGCSFASKVADKWTTNLGSGCGGFGFYTDGIKATDKNDEAVSFFGNLAESNYHSGIHLTKSSRINVFNNILSNNPFGLINSGTANEENLESSKITDNLFTQNGNSSLDLSAYSTTKKNKYGYAVSLTFEKESDRSNLLFDKNLYQIDPKTSYDVYTRLTSGSQLLLKTVNDIQANTAWEKSGKDIGNEIQIPTSTSFNTNQLSSGFGYTTSIPQDVTDTISRLEQELGISIQVNNFVGRNN